MTRRLAVLGLAAVWAATGSARAADDDPKAILARAVKAHGGEDVLGKRPGVEIRNKGKIKLPGVGEVDFTQHALVMPPDKIKEEMELAVMGQTVTVRTWVTGNKVVIEANGNEVPAPDETRAALKEAGHMLRVGRLVDLTRDKGFELSLVGEAKVEGKPAVGVRVAFKGQKDVNVYFDKETGLMSKLEHRTTSPATGNKEVTEERIVLEYTRKDGIPVPKRVLIRHDGEKFLEADVQEFTYLEKIPDGEFKK